jgi:translation initiation factor IF-2
MRIHELAKELGIASDDMLAQLQALGFDVKNRLSAATPEMVEKARAGAIVAAAKVQAKTPAKGHAKPAKDEAKSARPSETAAKPAPVAAPVAAAKPATVAPPVAAAKPAPVAPPVAPPAPVSAILPPANPVIKLQGPITVKLLATKMGIRPNRLITDLMRLNVLVSIAERVELDVARKVAIKHGFVIDYEKKMDVHKPVIRKPVDEREEEPDHEEDLVTRPPVVTFLGHVDHGKTSLLDRIRNTMVAKGEAGGITQHIGAYSVEVNGRAITFLDTPGHAAFTAMRARGANLTDIAIIIVAADDGVMPQTKEAIQHAKAAGVCIMVAINKIDMPVANIERAKQQLMAEGLSPEDWGGDTVCVPVSAATGVGIPELLDMILLQADVLQLKANPKRPATGYVVEAQLEQGMGPTATLLVRSGTLKLGDIVLSGSHWGRVRALITDQGVKIKSAGPATPIKCLGLSGVPDAGAYFKVYQNERAARDAAEVEQVKVKAGQLQPVRKVSLEDLLERVQADQQMELKVILKADTQGSIEAIQHALGEINSTKVALNILLSGAGNVTTNDVMLASASDAVILGFHVGKESGVPAAAKHEGVEIYLHQIIYELIDQVREAMTGMLAPKLVEHQRGRAMLKQVFDIAKRGRVAGCMATSGNIRPTYRARVRRGADVLFEGSILSLRRFQDEVAEVREGQECGVRLNNYTDYAVGDVLEFYEVEEVRQTL